LETPKIVKTALLIQLLSLNNANELIADVAGREKLADYLEASADEARNITHSFLGRFIVLWAI